MKDLVALGVTTTVVQRFEVVQVQIGKRERGAAALRECQIVLQPLFERAPREEPRQSVRLRQRSLIAKAFFAELSTEGSRAEKSRIG